MVIAFKTKGKTVRHLLRSMVFTTGCMMMGVSREPYQAGLLLMSCAMI